MDELRCGRERCSAGGAQLRDRQAVAPADRRGVPDSGWGTMQQIIPFSNTPLFLTGVIPRRAPCPPPTSCPDSPRSRAAAASSTVCGSCARKPCGPRWHPCRRLRPTWRRAGPDAVGHRLHARLHPLRAVRSRLPAAFGHTGLTNVAIWADPERDLSVGWSAAVSRAGTARPAAIPTCWTASRRRFPGSRGGRR